MKYQPIDVVNAIEWSIGTTAIASGLLCPILIAWQSKSYILSCAPIVILVVAFYVMEHLILAFGRVCDRGVTFPNLKLDAKQGLIAMGGIFYGLIFSVITTILSFAGIALSLF